MTRRLHWFRNDLRLRDNTALIDAARASDEVAGVFVFDPRILESPRVGASRVRFLLACLEPLARELAARGVPLFVRRGDPAEENPRVQDQEWKREYSRIRWEDAPDHFAAWCEGRTGYPLVDAGMRQLRETGWMHNRVRMVTASFLTKDLLIDWRRGEQWFLQRLVDADPASNNGGWQWAASTGADAAPYFRIFNPVSQGERFDPEGEYVRRWIPELAALPGKSAQRPWESPMLAGGYAERIVDHAERREEALARYQEARERTS